MHYLISRKNIPSQYIDLELTFECTKNEVIVLQLPSWRPGRYELANYAQRIRHLKLLVDGKEFPLSKITKDQWQFASPHTGSVLLQYQYHAAQMDAGGSWSDDEQLYINFINMAFQVKGREQESIRVQLNVPPDYRLATALPLSGPSLLEAEGFYHLVDSPLIASPSLTHEQYQIQEHAFHLWFQGEIHFDREELKKHFYNFSKQQIAAFGSFPAKDYHFLFQLLPYEHYHGVEHQFSTVITLGPATDFAHKAFMNKLMGVSSHELYHFWNVCRIRPEELLPYNFSKEAYFDTGLVAEGVTTYMGDRFLWKSGYYSTQDYLGVLEKLINREFEQFGWRNQSIVASSFDLWLDGYKAGVPNRKVSIYNRGALISLCLDLMLLDRESSLSQAMQMMWVNFGQQEIGYSLTDFQNLVGQQLQDGDGAGRFFEQYVYGTEDLLPVIQSQLQTVGISMAENSRGNLESDHGLFLDEGSTIKSIHPNSPAYTQLMVGDVVQSSEFKDSSAGAVLRLTVLRSRRTLVIELPSSGEIYFKHYRLTLGPSSEKLEHWKQQ